LLRYKFIEDAAVERERNVFLPCMRIEGVDCSSYLFPKPEEVEVSILACGWL